MQRQRLVISGLLFLAFLAAGAVVSIGVAWGAELLRAYRAAGARVSERAEWIEIDDPFGKLSGAGDRITVGVIRGIGRGEWTSDRQILLPGGAFEMAAAGTVPRWFAPPRPGQGNGLSVRAYGLPLRCMAAEMERSVVETAPNSFAMQVKWRDAWMVDLKGQGFLAVLPLRPLWAGLVVDSLVFGLLIASPWWVRGLVRWRRERRGWCVWCGYDLKGQGGVCPECGRDNHAALTRASGS